MPYLGTLGQQQRFAKSLDGIVSDPMDAEQQVNISGGELGELKNIAHRSSIQMCIVLVIFFAGTYPYVDMEFFWGASFLFWIIPRVDNNEPTSRRAHWCKPSSP